MADIIYCLYGNSWDVSIITIWAPNVAILLCDEYHCGISNGEVTFSNLTYTYKLYRVQ